MSLTKRHNKPRAIRKTTAEHRKRKNKNEKQTHVALRRLRRICSM